MKKVYFIYFILVSHLYGNTFTPLSDLIDKNSAQKIPAYQVSGTIFNAHETKTYPFNFQFQPTDQHGLYAIVKNPLCISEVEVGPNLAVLSSTFNVKHDGLIQRLQYNLRTGRKNEFDEVVFNFKLDALPVKEKGIYYNKNTIDTFSIIPVFQSLADKNINYISADLAVENNGMRVPILIQKQVTNRLDQYLLNYTVHEDFKKIIKNNNKTYIVFIFRVGGWQGFFYNHRHFYVFSSTPPYKYVGHWGGTDKLNLFSWVTD
ncbi:MAG: hypothetical protein VW397_01195 [Candidatus Margulisiibacteriota bacterium]